MIGRAPTRNVGEYCRLRCDDRDYECKVVEIGKENNVIVETIGFGLRITFPAKDLLPSLGKVAREEQEALARSFVENQVLWKVGDVCKILRDGVNADAKIVELASDENNRAYAVVCFLDNSVEDSVWLDDLKFPLPITWKVGDFCRAKWSEDQVIYEAAIKSIESGDTGQYAYVEFLGYGNCDSVWIDDIMVSNGDAARKAQIAESLNEVPPMAEATAPEPKVDKNCNEAGNEKPIKEWKVDDRCRAFYTLEQIELEGTVKEIKEDGSIYVRFIGVNGKGENKKASELMRSAGKEAREKQRAERAAKKDGQSTPKRPEEEVTVWEIGGYCRALSQHVGRECEGIIKSIDETDGQKFAVVQFLGFGIETEESVWFASLMQSQGADARKKQIENAPPVDTVDAGVKWKVGDDCRALFEVDNLEYEGTIEELAASEDRQYAVIKFIGYGDVQSVWAENILASKGKEARDAQIAAAAADLGETAVEQPVEQPQPMPTEQAQTMATEQPKTLDEPAEKKTKIEEEEKVEPMPAQSQKSHVEVVHVNGASDQALDISETDGSVRPILEHVKVACDDVNNNTNLDLNTTGKETLIAMLEEAQKKIVQLQAQVNVHEAVISEMRETNIFLKQQILPRVEFLCSQHSHVETLRAEKKTLLDDIISRKADQE